MNSEDFEKKMEALQKPDLGSMAPPKELKIAILSANRSAVIGIWFVVVPWFLLACVFMKYMMHVNLGVIDILEEMMSSLDKNPGTWWIGPVMLMGLPLISVVINALSISHFRWESVSKTLTVSIRMKWLNLLVLVLSAGVVKIFLLYLITENCR